MDSCCMITCSLGLLAIFLGSITYQVDLNCIQYDIPSSRTGNRKSLKRNSWRFCIVVSGIHFEIRHQILKYMDVTINHTRSIFYANDAELGFSSVVSTVRTVSVIFNRFYFFIKSLFATVSMNSRWIYIDSSRNKNTLLCDE